MPILHGYDVVAWVILERKRSQITMVLSKTLYGALEHNFTDALMAMAIMTSRLATGRYRKLYSQSWDAGLRYNGELIKSQLITSYSHSKITTTIRIMVVMIRPRRSMR